MRVHSSSLGRLFAGADAPVNDFGTGDAWNDADNAAYGARASVSGTSGNDFIHVAGDGLSPPHGYNNIAGATNGNDTITSGGGGDDIVYAGAGDDTIVFGSDFTAADQVNGGDGNDTVELNGDYSAGLVLAATTLTGVETVRLDGGHSYNLDFTNVPIFEPNAMTVDASALGAGSSLILRESVSPFEFTVIGGAGDDVVSLADGYKEFVDFSLGGNDTFTGDPDGDATVYMGGALTSADRIVGASDIELNGAYKGRLSLDSSFVENIGNFILDAGHNYNLVIKDPGVASEENVWLGFFANLRAGEKFRLDASALTADRGIGVTSSAGQNIIIGTSNADAFDFTTIGIDKVKGGDGDDIFRFDGDFDERSHIDGGSGSDRVVFDGDVSATLHHSNMVNVEMLEVGTLNSSSIKLARDLVTHNATLSIELDSFPTYTPPIVVDGSAIKTGHLSFEGYGPVTMIGGAESDYFNLIGGSSKTKAMGGGGNDIFSGDFGILTSGQLIDGGAGRDTIEITSNSGTDPGHILEALPNIEDVILGNGTSTGFTLVATDKTLSAGQTLTIDGTHLNAQQPLVFDGSAERDGSFILLGGDGIDFLGGGNQGDTLDGGAGNDHFVYTNVHQSTSTTFDTIDHFNAQQDFFDVWFRVQAMDGEIVGGNLSRTTLDADLAAAVNSHLHAGHAIVFLPSSGDFVGDSFLIVDANGVAGYQAGQDLVIDLHDGINLVITPGSFVDRG